MDRDLLTELIDKSEITLSPSGHGKHKKDTKVERTLVDYDLFYILSGSYALTINGGEYAASPGDSYLLTPESTFCADNKYRLRAAVLPLFGSICG